MRLRSGGGRCAESREQAAADVLLGLRGGRSPGSGPGSVESPAAEARSSRPDKCTGAMSAGDASWLSDDDECSDDVVGPSGQASESDEDRRDRFSEPENELEGRGAGFFRTPSSAYQRWWQPGGFGTCPCGCKPLL